jgi:hypothetical protein
LEAQARFPLRLARFHCSFRGSLAARRSSASLRSSIRHKFVFYFLLNGLSLCLKGEIHNNDFPTRLVANQPGTATLSVRAISDFSAISILNPSLEDSLSIEVVEKLELLSSKQLLLPFGSRFQIRTSHDGSRGLSYFVQIAYSARAAVLGELTVSSSGLISAGTTPLIATIYVTDSYKGLNQTVAISVEVAGVAQLSVTPDRMLSSSSSESPAPFYLPVGLSASLIATLQDASGRSFDTCDFSSLQVSDIYVHYSF